MAEPQWYIFYDLGLSYTLLVISFFGTILGMITFSKKKLNKFPMRRAYQLLLLSDSLYIANCVIKSTFLYTNLGLIKLLSTLACKLHLYTNFMLCAISSWLLVAISIERCISIIFGNNIGILRTNFLQYFLIFLAIVYNCLFYIPFFIYPELQKSYINETNTNESQIQSDCEFSENGQLFYLIDMMSAVIVPFVIMLLTSIILIAFVTKARLRVLSLTDNIEKKSLVKEIRFAVTILFMNFFFVILNLPICVANYIDSLSDFEYNIISFIFLISFCSNFYILLVFNIIIITEVVAMFKTLGRRNA